MKKINFARAEFSDLEELGWDFTELYESVQSAKMLDSIEDAESWEKENYHAVITVDEQGKTYWIPASHHNERQIGDRQDTGDDEKTQKDLVCLNEKNLLWDVYHEEE